MELPQKLAMLVDLNKMIKTAKATTLNPRTSAPAPFCPSHVPLF